MNIEEDYKRYLALSSELFCTFTIDGGVKELAGPWLEKTGKTGAEIENLFKLVHPDDLSFLQQGLALLKHPDAIYQTEMRLKKKSETYRWFKIKIVPSVRGESFILRASDISDQKTLRLEVDAVRQNLEIAIRAVKFGIWDWNLKTGALNWDSFMYELFEINKNDFTNDYEAFEKTLFKEDAARLQNELNETFKSRRPNFETEFRICTKRGEVRVIKAMARCFYDGHGNIDRLVGNNWDVTSIRQTEQDLREAHYEIERLFSISLDPMCIAYTNGYFKRVNQAFSDILGYTDEELTTQPFLNFVHPDDVGATKKEMENLARGIPTLRFENRYRTKLGAYRHFSWVVAPDQKDGLLYCVVRDLTDQLRTQHKALHAAQLASLGEMASGVAHEINNPLAIVQGKARQIERAICAEVMDVEKIRMNLQKIISTTDRIVKIVKGLRSFSRDSSKDPMEKTSVRSIVEEVLDLSGERFKYHQVELRVDIKSDIYIECRGVQIGQILMNLLNNGHDAVMDCEKKWVEICVQKIDSQVRIIVTDSGVGIKPQVANKMMQPFFTTKATGKGTGLGLSISKGIAEDHQGSLKFDSSSLHTRFVLELPVVQKLTPATGNTLIAQI